VVVGTATTGAGGKDLAVIRYLPDGTPDPSFGAFGKVTIDAFGQGKDDEAFAVTLLDDGRILIAGSATNGNKQQFVVARLLGNGFLDPSFGPSGGLDGRAFIDFGEITEVPYGMALQKDGKIVVAGKIGTGGLNNFALARLNAGGTLDQTFGGNANGPGRRFTYLASGSEEAHAVAIDANG